MQVIGSYRTASLTPIPISSPPLNANIDKYFNLVCLKHKIKSRSSPIPCHLARNRANYASRIILNPLGTIIHHQVYTLKFAYHG